MSSSYTIYSFSVSDRMVIVVICLIALSALAAADSVPRDSNRGLGSPIYVLNIRPRLKTTTTTTTTMMLMMMIVLKTNINNNKNTPHSTKRQPNLPSPPPRQHPHKIQTKQAPKHDNQTKVLMYNKEKSKTPCEAINYRSLDLHFA